MEIIFCCERMVGAVNDNLIRYSNSNNFIIRKKKDGYIIDYCPFCSAPLKIVNDFKKEEI